jgi:biopolymer transport protein ExbD
VVLYGCFLFYVGTLKSKRLKLQCLYLSLVIPLVTFLSYLWLKVIYEDHILSRAQKIELSQFTIFSLVTVVLLLLLSFKKEKTLASKAVSIQIPTADDLKIDMQDTSVSADADQVNIDDDKKGIDEELEKASSNEQTKKEIINEVVDESAGDLPTPSGEESTQASVADDEELPPPSMDELPSELAELKEGSESNESPDDLPPPSEKENAQVSMSDDEELPPPSVEELPAELAKLKEDGGEENSEIENPEIGKESSAT